MTVNYWDRIRKSRIERRRFLAASAGFAASAAFLAACGGDDDEPAGGSGEPQTSSEVVDPTKGTVGGKFVWQAFGDPGGGLNMLAAPNAGITQLAGLICEGLLEFRNGTPAHAGTDLETQPNVAQALPEIRPDGLTYVFKIRDGVTFHNGRALVAEDVKYSFDAYAASPWRNSLPWYEGTEVPDSKTVIVKTKSVYADTLASLTGYNNMLILAKEHQESADVDKAIVGTGPFLFAEYQPPTAMRYKRNPRYDRAPYPYFDEVERLGTSDTAKWIADFSSKQVHMTYYFYPEQRDQIMKARPDAKHWTYKLGAPVVIMRNDVAPFSDVRVRRALSMAIDRKSLSGAVTGGEGEADQWLSSTNDYWGFKKPSDLVAAKNFEYNVAEAKKLLEAAQVTLPLRVPVLPTWNSTVIGQTFVDTIVLIASQWKSSGLVDATVVEKTFGETVGKESVGDYPQMLWWVNPTGTSPIMGLNLRNRFFSPPTGVTPPTPNFSHINNAELTSLVEKQLTQLDVTQRRVTLGQISELLADQMPEIPSLPLITTWFADPSVKNMQSPRDAYNGATPYLKYWWFDRS